MTKKSRRLRTPNLPPEAFNIPTAASVAQGALATEGSPATAIATEDYAGVSGDLRRTLIIFAALAAAIVALSFVLR